MEEIVKVLAPWGLGGVLSGALLLAHWHLTTRVLPTVIKNFRADIAEARKDYLKSLRAERIFAIRGVKRIERATTANMQRVAEDLAKIEQAVDRMIVHRGSS